MSVTIDGRRWCKNGRKKLNSCFSERGVRKGPSCYNIAHVCTLVRLYEHSWNRAWWPSYMEATRDLISAYYIVLAISTELKPLALANNRWFTFRSHQVLRQCSRTPLLRRYFVCCCWAFKPRNVQSSYWFLSCIEWRPRDRQPRSEDMAWFVDLLLYTPTTVCTGKRAGNNRDSWPIEPLKYWPSTRCALHDPWPIGLSLANCVIPLHTYTAWTYSTIHMPKPSRIISQI